MFGERFTFTVGQGWCREVNSTLTHFCHFFFFFFWVTDKDCVTKTGKTCKGKFEGLVVLEPLFSQAP